MKLLLLLTTFFYTAILAIKAMVILLLLPGIMGSGVFRAKNGSPGGLDTAHPHPRLLL